MMLNLMPELSPVNLPNLSHFPATRKALGLPSLAAGRSSLFTQAQPATPTPSGAAPQRRWEQAIAACGLTRLRQFARPGAAGQPSPFHLLLPSDSAFEQLLRDWQLSWEALCADLPRLRHLLLGHVLMEAQDMPLQLQAPQSRLLRSANGSVLRLLPAGVLEDAQGGQARLRLPLPARFGALPRALSLDRVLRPAEFSLLDLLEQRPELSHFHAALRRSGLDHWLQGSGPFTVLAPSNRAWAGLAQQRGLSGTKLLASGADPLRELVGRYLIVGRWMSDELPWGHVLMTLTGELLPLSALGLLEPDSVACVLAQDSDQQARNGVLHRLESVRL